MSKDAQSLLDFINFLPLQAITFRRAPIDNREAQALFKIWESNLVVPNNIDPTTVAALTTKGLIKNKGSISLNSSHEVEITDKGKQIIKNIILYSEKSKFNKKSNGQFDYEMIHRAIHEPVEKTASVIISPRRNWLERSWNC